MCLSVSDETRRSHSSSRSASTASPSTNLNCSLGKVARRCSTFCAERSSPVHDVKATPRSVALGQQPPVAGPDLEHTAPVGEAAVPLDGGDERVTGELNAPGQP